MRAKAAIVSLILVLAAFTPLAGAYHMSVGNYDSATTSEEDSGSPTVPAGSGSADADGNLYERGLVTSGCYEAPEDADGSNAPSELGQAAPQDPICGRLMYNEGTDFVEPSPPDQDINVDDWEFDGLHTAYIGAFSLSTCLPWCLTGGETAYRAAHDAGATVGLTDNGNTAWEGDQGFQTYSPALLLPMATKTLTQESGAYEGNGWLFPYMDQSMMAFLTDESGNPVSEEDLAQTVSQLKNSGDLPQRAQPTICGFTPDDEITIDAPQIGFCEVAFEYNDDGDSFTDGADFQPSSSDDYDDPCDSPTYVCGANNPGWYAQKVCNPAASEECPTTPGVCQRLPGLAPCVEQLEQGDGFESTRDYDIWHWVVAPSEPSTCPTVIEPGFQTTPEGNAAPYIAHDLDIYVTPTGPAADASGQDELRGLESVEEYAVAVADTYREGASVPGIPNTDVQPVAKDDRVEPNAPGDTSQTNIDASASIDDPCLELAGVSDDVADPWVDIIDNTVFRDQSGDIATGPGDSKDLYLTSEDHQDASNRPGPGVYDTGGMVGVFTDRNDDGDYDQVGANDLFKDIQDVGAYPLFWDMRLDNNGNPALDKGCSQGFAQIKLTEQMVNAGYGAETGLIQVLYLSHPTTLVSERTGEAFPIATPNTAIVFESQSMRTLREDLGDTSYVDDAIAQLPATPAQRVYASDLAQDPSSDFSSQCGFATGGFALDWVFTHAAQAGSGGDTIVTEYVWENNADNGEIGAGSGDIPPLFIEGSAYSFDTGVNQWFDVDPIDNDPSRNNQDSSAPPH